jgi:hypothetical protein
MATAEELRRLREEESVFNRLYALARQQNADLAAEGRRPVLGGLLSKEPVQGVDTLRYEGIGNMLAGLLNPAAKAIDAPAAAARNTIPREDMLSEALGTAGMAMLGGGAVAAPTGALRSNSIAEMRRRANIERFGYDPNEPKASDVSTGGFEGYLSRVNPAGTRIAAEDRPNLMMGDMYGMLPRGSEAIAERGDVTFHRSPDGDYYATAYNPDVGEQDVVGYITGRGDSTELQVVSEMQGKGIGGELQYLFRSENPDAPTGGLTEAGERSLERTYDRLFDEGIVSANASKSAGALTVAADVAERGDTLIGMLKSGRAAEVTDDMLDMGDSVKNTQLNQYLFQNYDLPMDQASRMARAQEMGLIDPQYHATLADFENFKPSEIGLTGRGVYSGDYPTDISDYATKEGSSSGLNIIPLSAPSGDTYARKIDWQNVVDADEQFPWNATVDETIAGFKSAADKMSDQGYSGVHSQAGERVTFNPSSVRSRFARFDPRLSHLSNLTAANASPIGGILAQSSVSEEQARRIEDYLKKTGLLD